MLHYRMRVPIDEGSGPTVVLLHGIGTSAEYWRKTVDKLRQNNRVIAVDMLGFGISPKPLDINYSAADQARALRRALWSRRMRGKIVLVGFSLGGIVAVEFATRYPGKVSKLVLVSLPIYLNKNQMSKEILGRWQTVLSGTLNKTYVQFYKQIREQPKLTQNFLKTHKRLLPQFNHMEVTDVTWHGFAMSLDNAIERQRTARQLKRINCPIELFYGSFDPVIIRANVLLLQKTLPQAKFHMVAGGHDLPLKYFAQIAKACR